MWLENIKNKNPYHQYIWYMSVLNLGILEIGIK